MTKTEFDKIPDGSHVHLVCEDHPTTICSTKKVSVTVTDGVGRYNGRRGLFDVNGFCHCSADKLRIDIADD